SPSHAVCLSLLLCPPSPRSPLFPYTTLFRSLDASLCESCLTTFFHNADKGRSWRIISLHIPDANLSQQFALNNASIAPSLTGQHNEQTDHSVTLLTRSEEHTSELQSRFDLVCR